MEIKLNRVNKMLFNKIMLDALGEIPSAYRAMEDTDNSFYVQLIPLDMEHADMFVEVYCCFLDKVEWTVYALDENQYKELRTGTTEF